MIQLQKKAPALSQERILDIMHTHTTYRERKITWDTEGHKTEMAPEKRAMEAKRYARPLMDDREFLERLYAIVPPDFSLVKTEQVAAIYRLRAEYEYLGASAKGLPVYTDASVRGQWKTARENIKRKGNKAERDLIPLTPDEEKEVFGTPFHTLWFRLEDVLLHPLGRWPHAQPKKSVKAGRGRPRTRPQTVTYAQQIQAFEKESGDKVLDYDTVAAQLGVSTRTVYRWVQAKSIPSQEFSNDFVHHSFVLQSTLDELIAQKQGKE